MRVKDDGGRAGQHIEVARAKFYACNAITGPGSHAGFSINWKLVTPREINQKRSRCGMARLAVRSVRIASKFRKWPTSRVAKRICQMLCLPGYQARVWMILTENRRRRWLGEKCITKETHICTHLRKASARGTQEEMRVLSEFLSMFALRSKKITFYGTLMLGIVLLLRRRVFVIENAKESRERRERSASLFMVGASRCQTRPTTLAFLSSHSLFFAST